MLSEKQKRAVDYFIEFGEKTKAIVKAGYSKNTKPSVIFNKPDVKKYLQKRLSEFDNKRIADAQEVLKYLTSVMRGEEREQIVVMENDESGSLNPQKIDKAVSTKDRIKAAELIGKRYGMYTDKMNLENRTIPIIIRDDIDE